MTFKFNFLIVAPTPSTIGNCARDIKLALIEARRKRKKVILLRCYEIFRPLRIKVANKELFNIKSSLIYKPNIVFLFLIQFLLTVIFSLLRIASYIKRILFGYHFPYSLNIPSFGSFTIIKGNKNEFIPEKVYFEKWQGEFETPIDIQFEKNKIKKAKNLLRQMGLPKDQWFVCLHVREGGYHNDQTKERNAQISNYRLAIDYIVKQGGWVIRLGDKSMTRLDKINNVIDYPFTPYKSEFLDLYLIKNCRFYIGMTSGIFDVALLFDRPMAIVNSTNWIHGIPPKKNDVVLFKHVYSTRDKKFLSNYEWMSKGWKAMHYRSVGKNFFFIENTPQEILRAVKCLFKIRKKYIEIPKKYYDAKLKFGKKILNKRLFGYGKSQENFSKFVNNPYHPNANIYDFFVRYTLATVLFVRPKVVKNIAIKFSS